jgi:hypothetical protein
MSIAATSEAFAGHLRSLLDTAGGTEGWTVEARTVRAAVAAERKKVVTLILWRVQPEEPSDRDTPLRAASKGDPPEGTGLRLRYLLLVRGATAAEEQTVLDHCVAELGRNPVIAGGPAEALVVTLEAPPDEAYLRLLALGGDVPPPLLVPYAVHSVPMLPPAAGRTPGTP